MFGEDEKLNADTEKNFEKDYIGIEEQDIDDIDTNYFIAYAIFFVLF